MNLHIWGTLMDSLFDWDHQGARMIPGPNLEEWLMFLNCGDVDDVDRFYLDHETIGGG